jgi:hypothetical protein
MHGKRQADQAIMLESIGKNWLRDVSAVFRNGSFILKGGVTSDIGASYPEIHNLIGPLVNKY